MPYTDPIKQKEAQHRSYLKHKKETIKRAMGRHNLRKKWFRDEILSKLSCSRCPESDPVCLDFHHRDPKTKDYNVAQLARGFPKERILAEVAKCDVLCANCHRKEHGWIYN